MLQVQNLTAGYGPLTVLSDISLSLAGWRAARHLRPQRRRQDHAAALHRRRGAPARRQGRLRRRRYRRRDRRRRTCARGIAFVPQGHNVFPNLSVAQNLRIAGLLFDPAFVTQVYELFPVLAERRSSAPAR